MLREKKIEGLLMYKRMLKYVDAVYFLSPLYPVPKCFKLLISQLPKSRDTPQGNEPFVAAIHMAQRLCGHHLFDHVRKTKFKAKSPRALCWHHQPNNE